MSAEDVYIHLQNLPDPSPSAGGTSAPCSPLSSLCKEPSAPGTRASLPGSAHAAYTFHPLTLLPRSASLRLRAFPTASQHLGLHNRCCPFSPLSCRSRSRSASHSPAGTALLFLSWQYGSGCSHLCSPRKAPSSYASHSS